MKTMSNTWFRARRSALKLIGDCNAVAAVEFAIIVPIMLVMFFGTIEFSSAVAVDRKVTLIARTLSDLTSQSPGSVADTDLTNFFTASNAIMTPYPSTQNQTMTLTELYVVPVTLQVRVIWSMSAAFNSSGAIVLTPASTNPPPSPPVPFPSQLAVGGTYLIYSKVTYPYTPAVGYVLGVAPPSFPLSDVSYTRPRQSQCVIYPTPTPGTTVPCPTS
jgi:Flp pilus assembly protein TadG